MQELNAIFYVVVLIMSVVIHEVAHGYVAERMGDPTARLAGRLTLNPLKHLDPIGSVLIPLLLVITNAGFVFGWARPVPYNPNNLRDRKWGTVMVALAGVIANMGMAILFGLIIRFGGGMLGDAFVTIASTIVIVNLVLFFFNLVPIPPLDGSRILFALLPVRFRTLENFMERFALPILILFIIFVWKFISPLFFLTFALLTGL